jgi:hypothetical protein
MVMVVMRYIHHKLPARNQAFRRNCHADTSPETSGTAPRKHRDFSLFLFE